MIIYKLMEDEKIKKLNYINENIIEKGYNPEELSNYVIKKTGIPIDHMKLDQLKQMIENFKDQSLQDAYQIVQKKEISEKEESPLDLMYSPDKYDIPTVSQQKNILLELEQQNKRITITVSEPKVEKPGNFFIKPIYSYRIVTSVLEKDVRRTYSDFEWLREQLFQRYALRTVPPLIKEANFNQMDLIEKGDSEEVIEKSKVQYLNYFCNKLLERKIFRTSPILLEFLELEEGRFIKYKDLLFKKKYELSVSLDNLKTMKDKIHIEIKKESIKNAEIVNQKINKLS